MPLLPATFVPVRPVAKLKFIRCETSGFLHVDRTREDL